MSLFSKLRGQNSPAPPQRGSASAHGRVSVAVAAAPASATHAGSGYAPRVARLSNGLKEFLFQLEGIGRGHLLDLGPARQTTITFFIERGYKVYTEDLLTTWKSFLDADEQRVREFPPDADRSEMTPAARAERFLENTLRYPVDTFDAVLIWDLLDYLDSELVSRLVARMTSLVRDGGVVLAIFHTRKPEAFHRFRVLNAQNLEVIPAPCPFAPQRVYHNREISDLFRMFRSSKTFVGRDQLRETLFVK
ncbi:MAG: class I SAM-dependent methyltransferase [Acidobacteriia bacterium]|nr:class I SAM-dependent methyltransferase [Terriglobia bacterium]